MQFSDAGFPFTSMGFKGGARGNGIQVVAQGIAPQMVGGIFSTAAGNDGKEAYFGFVMSAAINAPNEFLAGITGSNVVRGIVLYDPSISQNDPAKADYYLKGTPMTVINEGVARYNTWGLTATGAAEPNLSSKIIFKDATGEIEFLDAATSVPGGWTQLTNSKVIDIDPTGQDGIAISFKL